MPNALADIYVLLVADGIVRSDLSDVAANDMEAAMSASKLPVFVCDLRTVSIRLANTPAAALVGLTPAELIGRSALDFLSDPEHAQQAQTAFLSGAIDSLNGRRSIRCADGRAVPALVWTKDVQIDGMPHTLTLAVPDTELRRLGRDPARPWRDLATIAVGTLDESRRISSVSADISKILGGKPADWLGMPLIRLVTSSQAQTVLDIISRPTIPATALSDLHLVDRDGASVIGSLLVAHAVGSSDVCAFFSVIRNEPADDTGSQSRVADLERRLQRIGTEVRAARVLEVMPRHSVADIQNHPQVVELSTRQWEVLGRVARGESIAAVAEELFVSPSTVRNHLTAIYRKFGVHSMPALLAGLQHYPKSS